MKLTDKVTIAVLLLLAVLIGGVLFANRRLGRKELAVSPAQVLQGANPQVKILEVGKPAPNFSVTTIDGERLTLSDFSDKILVITSGAAWCPTCIIEAKNFNPVFQEFKEKGVEFMTVDIDPRDDETAIAEFQRRYAPWHNVHSAQAKQMIDDYGFWRFEITYIIQDGIVQFADTEITETQTLQSRLNRVLQDL